MRRTTSRSSYSRVAEAVLVELVDAGARAGEQDRRVGGDDELGTALRRARDRGQHGERAGHRERGLGLVEDVEALAGEAVGGEREERLAVRLLVQLHAAVERQVRREGALAVDVGGHVEEALGAQEVAVARLRPALEHRLELPAEHGARHGRELAGALELPALRVEADRRRERLDQRRLAGAVVARQQRHGRAEIHAFDRGDRRDVERELAALHRPADPFQAEQVRARAGAADVPALQMRTTILPVLAPRSRSMNACGAASTPPSTIVSRYLTCPEATSGATSRTKSGWRSPWSRMM